MRHGWIGGMMLTAACALVVALWPGVDVLSGGIGLPGSAGPPPWNGDGQTAVTIEAEERPLAEVVASIEKAAGVNLLVTAKAADLPVTVALENVSWREALNVVGENAAAVPVSVRLKDVPWREALEYVAEETHCLLHDFGSRVIRIDRPPQVTFEFERADVRVVLGAVADIAGANIVVAPGVEGTVTTTLHQVPWPTALDSIVRSIGYEVVEEQHGILRIVDPADRIAATQGEDSRFAVDASEEADSRVTFDVKQRPLGEVLALIGEKTDVNLMPTPDAAEVPVTLKLTNIPWRDALEFVAEAARCRLVVRSPRIIAIDRPPRVTFEFDNAELKVVIRAIASIARANVVVAPEVQGTVTLRLHDVPWRAALDAVVRTLGYAVSEEDQGILRIHAPAETPR